MPLNEHNQHTSNLVYYISGFLYINIIARPEYPENISEFHKSTSISTPFFWNFNAFFPNILLFLQKELVAGLHLCPTNTSGCRLTLERGWRLHQWPPKVDMGAPTGWPAISWCSVTVEGTGNNTDKKTASGYVFLVKNMGSGVCVKAGMEAQSPWSL